MLLSWARQVLFSRAVFRSLEVLLPAVSWLTSMYEVDVELQVILAVLSDDLVFTLLFSQYGAKCACHTTSGLAKFELDSRPAEESVCTYQVSLQV